MKTRNGFVSNSSSSSFIVYGFVLSQEQAKKLQSRVEDDGEDYWDGDLAPDFPKDKVLHYDCSGIKSGCFLFGHEFANDSDGYLKSGKIDPHALNDLKKEMQEYLKTDEEPSIFFGTRCC